MSVRSYSISPYWGIISRIDLFIETEAAIKPTEGGSHQCPCVAIYDHVEQMQPKAPADFAALHCLCASRKVTAHGTWSARSKPRSCLRSKIFILHLSADQAEIFHCSHAAAWRTHQRNSTICLSAGLPQHSGNLSTVSGRCTLSVMEKPDCKALS